MPQILRLNTLYPLALVSTEKDVSCVSLYGFRILITWFTKYGYDYQIEVKITLDYNISFAEMCKKNKKSLFLHFHNNNSTGTKKEKLSFNNIFTDYFWCYCNDVWK